MQCEGSLQSVHCSNHHPQLWAWQLPSKGLIAHQQIWIPPSQEVVTGHAGSVHLLWMSWHSWGCQWLAFERTYAQDDHAAKSKLHPLMVVEALVFAKECLHSYPLTTAEKHQHVRLHVAPAELPCGTLGNLRAARQGKTETSLQVKLQVVPYQYFLGHLHLHQ